MDTGGTQTDNYVKCVRMLRKDCNVRFRLSRICFKDPDEAFEHSRIPGRWYTSASQTFSQMHQFHIPNCWERQSVSKEGNLNMNRTHCCITAVTAYLTGDRMHPGRRDVSDRAWCHPSSSTKFGSWNWAGTWVGLSKSLNCHPGPSSCSLPEPPGSASVRKRRRASSGVRKLYKGTCAFLLFRPITLGFSQSFTLILLSVIYVPQVSKLRSKGLHLLQAYKPYRWARGTGSHTKERRESAVGAGIIAVWLCLNELLILYLLALIISDLSGLRRPPFRSAADGLLQPQWRARNDNIANISSLIA